MVDHSNFQHCMQFMLFKSSFSQVADQVNLPTNFHLHVYLRKGARYLVYTDSGRWCWDEFLSSGLSHSKIFRYLEYKIDELGVERLIVDRVRS